MSEPTSMGSNTLDPVPDQSQDSGFFSDPTAPVWADPASPVQDSPPVRPAPLAPPGPAYSYGQQPAAPQGPAAPPQSNPYAQQPPVQQNGQQYGPPPVQQYGPPQDQQYGQPPVQQYGQPQAPAYGQPYGTGTPSRANASAITLTVLSALSLCNLLTIASLVLGIIALTKNSTDPEASRQMSNIGWIVFGVAWGLSILFFVVF